MSLVGACAALAAAAPPARAQDAQTQAMGRALFNEGMTLFNDGSYELACAKFEASLKHYPGLGTRGKLAECYEKLGRTASALLAYREVAQIAARTGDPVREKVASERARQLEPKAPTLTIAVPAAADVPGLVVKRAGRELERARIGVAEPTDPGAIAIEVSAPGRKPIATQLVLENGQRARYEVPTLATLDPPATAVAPVATEAEPAPATPHLSTYNELAPPVHHDPPSLQKPLGIGMMGLGVVGLGLSAVFGLSARSTYDDAFDGGGCDKGTKTCNAAGQSSVDDARSQATVSTVLFAAGAAVAVGGLVVFLTAPSSKRVGLTLTPAAHAGGGGVVLGGAL